MAAVIEFRPRALSQAIRVRALLIHRRHRRRECLRLDLLRADPPSWVQRNRRPQACRNYKTGLFGDLSVLRCGSIPCTPDTRLWATGLISAKIALSSITQTHQFQLRVYRVASTDALAWALRPVPFIFNRDNILLTYSVKEIFYTLQGEGAQAGRPAVFCRFSGCNLWSGRESDRATAICKFCDTDFVGTDGELGGKFTDSDSLAATINSLWPASYTASKYVVFTGGEPLLQLDAALIDSIHKCGFEIAIETNGTLPVPPGVDWICVSPKFGSELRVHKGSELKVVIPQVGQALDDYAALEFDHFFVQPMDGPALEKNVRLAIDVCKRNPKWKLSLQTHKLLQIP
jgi:7-carboxy-7-deazaguanine synthase